MAKGGLARRLEVGLAPSKTTNTRDAGRKECIWQSSKRSCARMKTALRSDASKPLRGKWVPLANYA